MSVTPESSDVSSITVSSQLSYDEVRKSVSKLKEKLEDFCKKEIENISDRGKVIRHVIRRVSQNI